MTSKAEKECQSIAEEIFGLTFEKVRMISNPETGRMLELDMYNKSSKVAIEYNGKQHYVFPNIFHKTEKEFISQIRRDDYKRKWCKYNEIFLITVPYTIRDIRGYLTEKRDQWMNKTS